MKQKRQKDDLMIYLVTNLLELVQRQVRCLHPESELPLSLNPKSNRHKIIKECFKKILWKFYSPELYEMLLTGEV